MPNASPVEIAVPAVVTELRLLERVDYEDAFTIQCAPGCGPAVMMRDVPYAFALPWLAGAKLLFRAEVGPLRGPDHLIGWRVLERRPDLVALGIDSARGLSARLIGVASPGYITVATQVQTSTAYARLLWPRIQPAHRFFAPYLLGRAVHRFDAQAAAAVTVRNSASASSIS